MLKVITSADLDWASAMSEMLLIMWQKWALRGGREQRQLEAGASERLSEKKRLHF